MISTIVYTLNILITVAVVVNLLYSGARPTKTLGWLLVVFLLPIFGVVAYLIFGLNRRKYKFSRIKDAERVRDYFKKRDNFYEDYLSNRIYLNNESDIHRKLLHLISKNAQFLPFPGNAVKILRNGPDTFESIFAALEKAEKFIHVQYYIFEEGELTEKMLEIFERKFKEGVEIRLLFDGVGSQALSNKFLRRFKNLGGFYCCFLPIANLRPTFTLNYRNHRKIIVIDGKIGFTGGINVTDKYVKEGASPLGIWHDMHIRLEGPVVNNLNAIFVTDWFFATNDNDNEDLLQPAYFPKVESAGDSLVQIVSSGPDSNFPNIQQSYFSLINQADDYVYITNPYVIPGDAILTALQTAALSDIDVRIIIPEISDSIVVKWGVRSYFEDLLRAGVRIFMYPEKFLHNKTIVVDDEIGSVGTANFDIRSFEQNFEVNALIYNEKIAEELKSYFLEDMKTCREFSLEEYLNRPWYHKLLEGLAKIFSPIL